MEKSISKKEREYILFNIRGFFKHYKIEQNINKLSIDISNIQILEKEVNNMVKELSELNTNLINNQLYRKKLLVNRKHKFITKSTDIVIKKNVEIKQKTKLNDLKYDLNQSNLTSRPKTPDVSQIFNKYKKKKNITNIGIKSNNNFIDKHNKLESSSFMAQKHFFTTKTNNLLNKSNQYISLNKLQYKTKRESSIDNKLKDNSVKTLNYTMIKALPTHSENNIKQKNIKKINDKSDKSISPLKVMTKKDNNLDLNTSKKTSEEKDIYINKLVKTKKIKKLITNTILSQRFHSSDIAQKKINNEQKDLLKNMINKKINKKIFKLEFKKRLNAKTPSPINYRQSSPLLIDHDTIIRNKNKKINYNGNYYNEHFSKKILQNKISNPNLIKNKKNTKHNKILSDNKDLTREEEKKLDEHIISSIGNNLNNNTKNIIDISQHILQNLDYINPVNLNNHSNFNVDKKSEINNNNMNKSNKKKIILNKNILDKSNYIKSLYLAIKMGFFDPHNTLNLLLMSKDLFFSFEINEIIIDLIEYYEKKIHIINNKINKYDINIINKPFTPRKTGLNSLNFITKNEEQRLINEKQHDYVIKIFKIILILLNEYKFPAFNDNNEEENNSKIFEYIFNDIYTKQKVNNIKDLFIKNFVDKIPLISDIQFVKINEIVNEIPELLSPSTILAYNRNVSYLTFFLSELYNYLKLKTDDDIYYYKIRNDYFELNQYINRINNLKANLS
jgi:hypothetical protein